MDIRIGMWVDEDNQWLTDFIDPTKDWHKEQLERMVAGVKSDLESFRIQTVVMNINFDIIFASLRIRYEIGYQRSRDDNEPIVYPEVHPILSTVVTELPSDPTTGFYNMIQTFGINTMINCFSTMYCHVMKQLHTEQLLYGVARLTGDSLKPKGTIND